jgi:hypothetical protein
MHYLRIDSVHKGDLVVSFFGVGLLNRHGVDPPEQTEIAILTGLV